jgi:hypothetical protein
VLTKVLAHYGTKTDVRMCKIPSPLQD